MPSPNSTPTRLPTSSSTYQEDSETPPRKVRSLRDIYESSDIVLFSCEPQNFEEASKENVWKKAMDEEIATTEKNKTLELVDLLKEKMFLDYSGFTRLSSKKMAPFKNINKTGSKGLFSTAWD